MADALGCESRDIPGYMKKKVGDAVEQGDLLAETPGLLGLFKCQARASITGVIESVSEVSGQAHIRGKPLPIEVTAFTDGKVVEVFPGAGVIIEAWAMYVQGIFGIGPEAIGTLAMGVQTNSEILHQDHISREHKGKIIVGGALAPLETLRKAVEVGVKGIIVGGCEAQDLKMFLGYDVGVAVTGHESVGLTLVLTEGFGKMNMAQKTFELLSCHSGMKASMNGATQIRAGVIRPEVLVCLKSDFQDVDGPKGAGDLEIGSLVRMVRQPQFGSLARIVGLPKEPVKIETEAMVRVVEVECLSSHERLTIPRANVEIMEE